MNVKKDILWRVYIVFLLVAVLAGAVLFKMARLQTVNRVSLTKLADSMSTKWDSISPIRGNIYSSDGSLLATSIPIYEAHMDMMADGLTDTLWKNNIDSLSRSMSAYFKDKSAADYKNEFSQARHQHNRYFLVKRNLTHNQITDIRKFPIFKLGRYAGGLRLVEKSKRFLPFQTLGFRTIGYTRDGINTGLEGYFNKDLQGLKGRRLMQKVSGGMVPVNEENELDPKDGSDIITTLDINFQDITENALLKSLTENNAAHGCAIVMEVATGKIKAVANLTRENGEYVEEYNYAIGEAIEPGSTFKLASVMALLEKQKCTPDTKVASAGQVSFCGHEIHESKEGGHGIISLREAFELSSNVGISKLVYNAFADNPQEYTDFLYSLKLNNKLNLQIPGEGVPIVKNPHSKSWSCTSLPWMSIGYEVMVTPLQILTLYNAVANNGIMVKPLFVTEIEDVGKPVRQYNTEIINPKICSDKTLSEVKEFMEGVVDHGTATNIKNGLYKIAGKTGTAQIADNNKGYGGNGQKIYQSSFVGYFPANKPAYSIIVVISSPSNGVYYGGAVSAPVFKEISDKIFARTATIHNYASAFENTMDAQIPLVAATNQEYLSTLMAVYGSSNQLQVTPEKNTWVKAKAVNNRISLSDYKQLEKRVPDVTGMVLSDAVFVLENAGLRARFTGTGKVVSQSMNPGTMASNGDIIELKLN
jgi:cell division protein FtsI (penicillin-binding protein 3)